MLVNCKVGGAGDKFGDCLGVDCANVSVSGHNQFENTNFTRPFPKISKYS